MNMWNCNNLQCCINRSNNKQTIMDTLDSLGRAVTDILSDLGSPKFSNREMQNAVQFLSDFDSYFLARNVPESSSLHWSKKVVVKHNFVYYTSSVQLCDNKQYLLPIYWADTCGQTNGRTDRRKLMDAFRDLCERAEKSQVMRTVDCPD